MEFCICKSDADNPRTKVSEGVVMGKTELFTENQFINVSAEIDIYLGIPYAEVPVRFEPPVKKIPWEGEWNATSFTQSCSQAPHLYYPPSNEDCLYLNVYSPHPKPLNTAVMVWIHGGSYIMGTAMTWDFYGLPLVAVGDVILVTLNYRLGIFSQFTTGDDEAPGNFGMLDQQMALEWVKNNIKAFGGDPNRVTIFGVSAGSSSVNYHLLSKQSRGLFSQAIMQSGSALAFWAFSNDTTKERNKASNLALAMGCNVTNSTTMVECLRAKPADDLRRSADKIYGSYTIYADGRFLEASPSTLYQEAEFAHVPIMAGIGRDEGTLLPYEDLLQYQGSPIPPYLNETMFEYYMSYFTNSLMIATEDKALVQAAISQEYVDWSHADDVGADYFTSIVDMAGDVIFACANDRVLRFHSQANDTVFLYYMTHKPTATSYSQRGDIVPFTPWIGAGHGEELMFVFGMPFIEQLRDIHGHTMTDDEKAMSVRVMKFWTNFAKYGDPSQSSEDGNRGEGPEGWPVFTIPELRYKEISLSMGDGRAIRARQCNLWNHHIPSLSASNDLLGEDERAWRESYEAWRQEMESWRREFKNYQDQTLCP
ncbi:acetylcholinesterase-like [Diadema antillarum]|uniref:acetylcholinesterase-like n=1 Tax=Diadema antillarum TaxID=105358 RepID=UPI003A8AF43D